MFQGIITGRLGKDAVQHIYQDQSCVRFSVAIDLSFKDKKTGKKVENVHWQECTVWGTRGEKLLPYLKKGTLVHIMGEMKPTEYTNKEGNIVKYCTMNVEKIEFLGGGNKSESNEEPENKTQKTPTTQQTQDDDFPFD